tara:strand:+ start:751 stop:975 length:225 start_codon:yes stop_codon:yes gene_type:complete
VLVVQVEMQVNMEMLEVVVFPSLDHQDKQQVEVVEQLVHNHLEPIQVAMVLLVVVVLVTLQTVVLLLHLHSQAR